MGFKNDNAPIIAIASGSQVTSSVGIIRLSGFSSLTELSSAFSFDLQRLEPRKLYLSNILETNTVIDQALIAFFPAPYSFTGENVLEIQGHGNPIILQNIINLFCTNFGFRLADRGEFSWRAFKNKKMSILEIEGLDLILNGATNHSISQGISLLNGRLNDDYNRLRETYLSFKSAIEILFDFSEDVGEETSKLNLQKSWVNFYEQVNKLAKRSQLELDLNLTPEIGLFGVPNVGKSSFFNYVMNKRRAIVSATPGTTTDYISEDVVFEGHRFKIIDTAGIRETSRVVEQEGVSASKVLSQAVFFKVLLTNVFLEDSVQFFTKHKSSFDFYLFPFADLPEHKDRLNKLLPMLEDSSFSVIPMGGPIEPLKSIGPIGPIFQGGPIGPVHPMGGPIEPGFTKLRESVVAKLSKILDKDPLITRRHCNIIQKIKGMTDQIDAQNPGEGDLVIISSLTEQVSWSIDELLGVVSVDSVLNNIFENFCIGK
jgi:tRNA modification GTPase